MQIIAVFPPFRIESGVKIRFGREKPLDRYGGRQHSVELVTYLLAVESGSAVEMSDVSACIDPCVGTPRTGHGNPVLQKDSERFFEGPLYGRLVRLDLPSEKGGAVVGKDDSVSHAANIQN